MTYEEALEIIRQHEIAITRGTSKNTLAFALCVAEKALEKQTPKKVINLRTDTDFEFAECPECKNHVDLEKFKSFVIFDKFCSQCGQRLEWGKIEEE